MRCIICWKVPTNWLHASCTRRREPIIQQCAILGVCYLISSRETRQNRGNYETHQHCFDHSVEHHFRQQPCNKHADYYTAKIVKSISKYSFAPLYTRQLLKRCINFIYYFGKHAISVFSLVRVRCFANDPLIKTSILNFTIVLVELCLQYDVGFWIKWVIKKSQSNRLSKIKYFIMHVLIKIINN